MADIAVVFHWPPEALYNMALSELFDWWEEARLRSSNDN